MTEINFRYCAFPEKIHTHTMEGHWKFLGGGVAKYEAKLEFLGGMEGAKQKNLMWEEYGYFLDLHITDSRY